MAPKRHLGKGIAIGPAPFENSTVIATLAGGYAWQIWFTTRYIHLVFTWWSRGTSLRN
jgi:hypothetical protein